MGYGSGIATSCGLGLRGGSDPMLLQAWEHPYAASAALKSNKTKQNQTSAQGHTVSEDRNMVRT